MSHIFISFLFYNLILIILYKHYKKGEYYIKKSDLFFYTILFIAFGTYGGGEGDFLHYQERVSLFQFLDDVYYYDMMEVQYNYLAYWLHGNYYLWRLVIFSVEFIGMSWFMYKAKLNTYPIFICFVAYCMILSVYNRGFWGGIYFFMGLYLLIEKKNPLFLIAIALCYFSHTQNIVLLALLPLGFIRFKSWHFLLILLSAGMIVVLLHDTFNNILDAGGIEGADYINKKMDDYSQSRISNFGNSIGEIVIFILRYVPMFIIVFSWITLVIKNRDKYLSLYKPYRGVINVTIGLIIIAIIILFASLGGGTFFYRVLSMALFPLSITLPYLFEEGVLRVRTFNFYIVFFIIGSELNYIKDLYYAYVGGL